MVVAMVMLTNAVRGRLSTLLSYMDLSGLIHSRYYAREGMPNTLHATIRMACPDALLSVLGSDDPFLFQSIANTRLIKCSMYSLLKSYTQIITKLHIVIINATVVVVICTAVR